MLPPFDSALIAVSRPVPLLASRLSYHVTRTAGNATRPSADSIDHNPSLGRACVKHEAATAPAGGPLREIRLALAADSG